MPISRRQFLKTSAAIVPAAAVMPAVFRRAVAASIYEQPSHPAPMGERTLVIVQMAGGNDGLNTVVPANDSRYYELRSDLAVAQEQVLALDRDTALHPALAMFKELWDEGVLAIVEGVGYPDPSYSHFQSMDTWQTADPNGRQFDGWLARYLRGTMAAQEDSFHALSVGRSLPRALYADGLSVPSIASVERYQFQADPRNPQDLASRTEAMSKLYASDPTAMPFGVLLDNTLEAALRSSAAILRAHAAYEPAVSYPDSKLGRGLRLMAEAIDGDLGVRVGHVRIGGFDTHAQQLPEHTELLTDTANSVHAFYRDLQAHGRDRNVVVMTWSEFGRRVTSNASGGTDHGSAGPMFLVGTPVAGALYGERPSLSDLDRNNLKFTTDFRSVYASVLEGWLGAPASMVLGAEFEQLPIMKAGAGATASHTN
ncbi:MAG: DUF1501 domain-containing protein [Chloroflexi bacterium]|nr:DUF1501 domain-containing protein [Chloroflexota bacterium]